MVDLDCSLLVSLKRAIGLALYLAFRTLLSNKLLFSLGMVAGCQVTAMAFRPF